MAENENMNAAPEDENVVYEDVEIKEYVTSDMLMGEIIMKYPIAIRALMECGMGCVSCPSAQMESLAEASMVHGLDVKEVQDYVNERISYAVQFGEEANGGANDYSSMGFYF